MADPSVASASDNKPALLDMVCIGSALQDVFINVPVDEDATAFVRSNHLSVALGAKINVDFPTIEVGGGGTNTAINFSIQGLNAAILSRIANDAGGQLMLGRMADFHVNTEFLQIDSSPQARTGMSIILNVPHHDRVVLVNRGVSHLLDFDAVNWSRLQQTRWIYIASYGSPHKDDFQRIAKLAQDYQIKIAFNPSINQIKRGLDDLRPLIEQTSILSMNRSEAALLTNSKKNERITVLLDKLKDLGPELALVTHGANGVFAADSKNNRYYIPPLKVEALSTLGAGDAFCSTFTASIIKDGWDIPLALKRANMNAAQVIQQPGAQRGLEPMERLDAYLEHHPMTVESLSSEAVS